MQYNGQIPHRLASTGVEVATSRVRLPARIAKAEKAIRQAARIFFFMVLSSKNGNGPPECTPVVQQVCAAVDRPFRLR